MKHLYDYIEEDCAIPANTTGIGNPSLPTENQIGSGDNLVIKKKRKKKEK